MQYKHVPGVEKPISQLVQGTVYFSDNQQANVFALFDAVFELGCNTFDTAHVYEAGGSERLLGRWIASRGVRDEVVILDKGGHPYDGQQRVTPEFITADLTESLERLGVDCIDLYMLHRDDPTQPVGPLIDILNEHYQAGRITAFGGSNWTHDRIREANAYAEVNGLVPFVASSPQLSLAEMVNPPWEGCISIGGARGKDARVWYENNQMALFTWSSLAGGFMTGRYRRDNLDTFSDYFEKTTVHAYAHEANFQRLERAQTLAPRKAVSVPQLALAYVLSQPQNIFALVGARSGAEFSANLAALDVRLTVAEMAWLDLEGEVY